MTAALDTTMRWPPFVTRDAVIGEIRAIASAKTEADAFGLLMGCTIGAYVEVEKHRTEGMDVREAARKALEGMT